MGIEEAKGLFRRNTSLDGHDVRFYVDKRGQVYIPTTINVKTDRWETFNCSMTLGMRASSETFT